MPTGRVCWSGGLPITEGGKAQPGLLFPCSNFSGVGKLLKGGDGVSSQPPRCLQHAFSESGYQPTAEDGYQPKWVRVGDVRYSYVRLFAEPLLQTVPVKREGAAPRSPSSGSRSHPSQPWSASHLPPAPRQPLGELRSPLRS